MTFMKEEIDRQKARAANAGGRHGRAATVSACESRHLWRDLLVSVSNPLPVTQAGSLLYRRLAVGRPSKLQIRAITRAVLGLGISLELGAWNLEFSRGCKLEKRH